jgi:hypothetical protein
MRPSQHIQHLLTIMPKINQRNNYERTLTRRETANTLARLMEIHHCKTRVRFNNNKKINQTH